MANPDAAFAAVLLSITLTGCGSDQSLGGPVVCSPGAELELIDDMEDDDYGLLRINGRAGNWFAFNDDSDDRTPDGEQTPRPNTGFPMARIEPPRDESQLSIRTHGHGFEEWGAGVGFDINTGAPYDASPYLGIGFWARRGAGTAESVRMDVTDRNTAPGGRVCDEFANCDRSGMCAAELRVCYDTFGKIVSLTEDWEFYRYTWADLEQVGWSGNRYPAIVHSEIYGMRFQTDPRVDFDYWIDDLAFLCR